MRDLDQMAAGALNEAAKSLIYPDGSQLRGPEDSTIMEALNAQTHALIGVGYLLQAILAELRKR